MDNAKSTKYLKSYQYYNDRYDRLIVDECRRTERQFDDIIREHLKKVKNKKDLDVQIRATEAARGVSLYFIKGQRYDEKEDRIKEWMEKDRQRDEKLENAKPLTGVICSRCGSEMNCTMKDLHEKDDYGLGSNGEILFFYKCPSCDKMRAFWENGEEYKPREHKCSKCNAIIKKEQSKREGNKITTTYICSSCGHKEIDVLDLDEEPEIEEEDKNFEKDRKKYCLSEDEGKEYIESKINLKRLKNATDKMEERMKNKGFYRKVEDIKKLKVTELKDLLDKALEKEGYIQLEFSQPEIGQYVIISFTIQDKKSKREEDNSKNELKKSVNKTLSNTNWRLMSEGIDYRLGILFGRLKGLEREEDLMKLINNKNEQKNKI